MEKKKEISLIDSLLKDGYKEHQRLPELGIKIFKKGKYLKVIINDEKVRSDHKFRHTKHFDQLIDQIKKDSTNHLKPEKELSDDEKLKIQHDKLEEILSRNKSGSI